MLYILLCGVPPFWAGDYQVFFVMLFNFQPLQLLHTHVQIEKKYLK